MQIQIRLSWKWFHMHRRILAPPECAISSPPPLCTCSGCSCPPANRKCFICCLFNSCFKVMLLSSCKQKCLKVLLETIVFLFVFLFSFLLFVNLLSYWKHCDLQIFNTFCSVQKEFSHILNCFQSPCWAFWINVKTSERWIIGNARRLSVPWFRIRQVSIWRLSSSLLNGLFASHLSMDTIDSLNWLLIKSNNCK